MPAECDCNKTFQIDVDVSKNYCCDLDERMLKIVLLLISFMLVITLLKK